MKLGFSLNPQLILGHPENESSALFYAPFGNSTNLLKELKDQGISSIELRNLPRHTDAETSKRVIHTVWEAGLDLTVHGHVAGHFEGPLFADIYPSILEMITHGGLYQKNIVMPIHAFAASEGSEQELCDKTIALFQLWTSLVERERIPLLFAIELNRKKPTTVDPGDTCAGVLQMIDQINSPFVGITWDMGHFYANLLSAARNPDGRDELLDATPPRAFLEKTVHTHIHGLGIHGTHGPLTPMESLPLESYVQALQNHGYQGIYNLELQFNRFPNPDRLVEDAWTSIDRLRNCVSDVSGVA